MATIRIVLGIICLALYGQYAQLNRGVLKDCGLWVVGDGAGCLGTLPLNAQARNPQPMVRNKEQQRIAISNEYSNEITKEFLFRSFPTVREDEEKRNMLVNIARSQIGIREVTGNNDGTRVEAFLKVTHLAKGYPWCAAFVSWVFKQANYHQPRTAWSPAMFPLARQTLHPKPADVIGIYSPKFKRIAHCGLVERRQNNWIISIEGNTNVQGSREGDGVYRKWRHIRSIARFADWIKPLKGGSYGKG